MKNTALKWVYTVPGKKKGYVLILSLVQAVYGASGVLYALLLRGIVDSAADRDRDSFLRYVLFIILLVVVQLLLRALVRRLTEYTKATFENIFKARLFETLLKKDYSEVSSVHSGEWLNRLTSDTTVVANGYADILPGLFGMSVKLISAVVMILILEPRFALFVLLAGLVLIVFSFLFRKVLKRMHKEVQEADGRFRSFIHERIVSLLIVRSFVAEEQTLESAYDRMDSHKAARMKKNRFSNFCNIGFGALMSGMYLFGVIWCGFGIINGTITFGTLTAITQLITQIQAPFANISGYLPQYFAVIASAERLMEAEDFKDDDFSPKSLAEISSFYENELSSFGLKDVSFAYESDVDAAVENISLCIEKGKHTAFTGESGCGKSTVLKLLMCIYSPDSGERYFADKSGKLFSLDSSYRRLFAYVPQGNGLMSGTVREVVSLASPADARDESRILHALEVACAKDFVLELKDGIDTVLGELGSGLSEGQMQRLAVARAVFSGCPVLLLDESTSALDAATEQQLLDNLRTMTDTTIVIVTHRKSALSICDSVFEFTETGVICNDK